MKGRFDARDGLDDSARMSSAVFLFRSHEHQSWYRERLRDFEAGLGSLIVFITP